MIAGIIGIPLAGWTRDKQWSDVVLRLSYTRSDGDGPELATQAFLHVLPKCR
jgi:hypothetical protein